LLAHDDSRKPLEASWTPSQRGHAGRIVHQPGDSTLAPESPDAILEVVLGLD
jgi:hypothetical protein